MPMHRLAAVGPTAAQDVLDFTVEIRADGLTDGTTNHDDVLNQPQLSQ